MGLILVTGGVRSGKSKFAEDLAASRSPSVLYVATGVGGDQEMAQRIQLHKDRRPVDWGWMESPYQLRESVEKYGSFDVVLVDCLSAWISNRLIQVPEDKCRDRETTEGILQELQHWLRDIKELKSSVILVTTEAGLGGVAMSPLGRWFQDVLGEANQLAAREAAEVYAVISGIPWRIKG